MDGTVDAIVKQLLGYGLPGIIIIIQFYVIAKLDERSTKRSDAAAKLHDDYAAKDNARTERLAVIIAENTRSNEKVAESYAAIAATLDRLVRMAESSRSTGGRD